MRIYTIGHSNHSIEFFIELLRRFDIEVLVDVRSYPYSKYVPHFNRENLNPVLEDAGIEYVYMGNLLGGLYTLGKRKELLKPDGKIDWKKVREQDFFKEGMDKLIKLAEDRTVAVMCAEENPLRCHRFFLISPALVEQGVEVLHIRKTGKAQSDSSLRKKNPSLF